MITVHHLNNSRSHRVLWLLEELDLPYEIVRYQRDPRTKLAPAELRAIHPLGKSPIITDDGQVIAESGAIIEYVLATYGKGRLAPPKPSDDALRFTYWLHYAEGSLMPIVLMKLMLRAISKGPVPFFLKPLSKGIAKGVERAFVGPQSTTHFRFIETELAKRRWFAGDDFTAADIQMSFPLEAAAAQKSVDPVRYPRISAWLGVIRARSAYGRAIERGGEFRLGAF